MEPIIITILIMLVIVLGGFTAYLSTRPPKIIEKDILAEEARQKEKELEARINKRENEFNQEIYQRKLEQEKQLNLERLEVQRILTEEKNKMLQVVKTEENQIRFQFDELRNKLELEHESYINLHRELNQKKIEEIDAELERFKAIRSADKLNYELQVELFKAEVEQWRQKHQSVIDTFENIERIKEADNYHRIILSEYEFEELEELGKAIRKLKNPMPFYKAIYDIYYKQKVNDLIIRVVGKGRVSGIYKITHIGSGKCYVGQSVDIGERWKQHCKRGCGSEIVTQNKLYPAMLEHGIYNFLFEVLESTEDTSKLGEMEKYWQNYYKAQEFGYSIR